MSIGTLKAKSNRWPNNGEDYAPQIAQWLGEQLVGRYTNEGPFTAWRLADGTGPVESRYKQVSLVGDEIIQLSGAKFGQRDGIIFLGESLNISGFIGQPVKLEINIRQATENFGAEFRTALDAIIESIPETDIESLGARIKKDFEARKIEMTAEVVRQRAETTPQWGDW